MDADTDPRLNIELQIAPNDRAPKVSVTALYFDPGGVESEGIVSAIAIAGDHAERSFIEARGTKLAGQPHLYQFRESDVIPRDRHALRQLPPCPHLP
jgi:hypothetical protein